MEGMVQRMTFREYMELQVARALSPDNYWYAGEHLGHSPSELEAVEYYIRCGAARQFKECYFHVIIWGSESSVA